MKGNKNIGNKAKMIAVAACFSALSIVFGKLLPINIGDSLRFSFENLPIIIAGFYFGPVVGALVGTVADIVGCLIVGYTINPIITAGAAAVGLCAGFGGMLSVKSDFLRVLFSGISAHLIGSVIIKTTGLIIYRHSPAVETFFLRTLIYSVTAALEIAVLFVINKNRAFKKQMEKFKNGMINN